MRTLQTIKLNCRAIECNFVLFWVFLTCDFNKSSDVEILFVHRRAKALYDCDAEDDVELSFHEDEILFHS